MGSGESRLLHPKNEELLKHKKKHDTTPIKDAKLVTIWVIGSVPDAAKELAILIASRMGYVTLNEKDLLATEAAATSERAYVIKDILQDKGIVSPVIVLDLLMEALLARTSATKGIVLVGIPRSKNQARQLEKLIEGRTEQKIILVSKLSFRRQHLTDTVNWPRFNYRVTRFLDQHPIPKCLTGANNTIYIETGPVRLIVHMKFSNEAAKSALLTSGCEEEEVNKRIELFNTLSLQLTRHKKTVTVNGEAGATSCFNELSEKLSGISASSL